MRVSELWIYPVKSCRGMRVEEAEARPRGFAGDRRWMLVDADGRHVTQREFGVLARFEIAPERDGVRFVGGPYVSAADCREPAPITVWGDALTVPVAPDAMNAWISAQVGAPLRLVHLPPGVTRPADPDYAREGDEVSFADGYPFLVTVTASLSELNRHLDEPVSMRRFRPNIIVDGAEPFEEDGWRRIRIGEVELELVKPCARCVVVDTDPDTGEREKGVLAALARFRRWDGKVYFGMNAVPERLGALSTGVPVEIEA